MTRKYSRYETAPFCATENGQVKITLRDGEGGLTTGYVSASEARSLTLGLRSVASEIDGGEFFAGGWSKARVLEAVAQDYIRLVEGDGSELLSQ